MQVTSRHTSNDNWSESSWSETHTRPGQDHHHVLSEPSAGLTPSQPRRPLRPGPYGMGPVGSHCSSSGVSELAKTTVSTHITSFGPYTKPEWMQSKGMCRTKDPPKSRRSAQSCSRDGSATGAQAWEATPSPPFRRILLNLNPFPEIPTGSESAQARAASKGG